ncbi:MAG: N-acetyltransferase, partial [Anaerolineaceae bacterium]|nr:N-acetyltransferase [Anaerolineaceae bacterium]
MQIIQVQSKAELKQFIEVPYQFYKHDSNWVAPLRSEQAGQYDLVKNPMLDHCTYTLFLLKEGGKVLGRVSAFTDRLALEAWQQPIGLFGSFECINDPAAARLLLDAARNWLKSQGMSTMRGPWSFASQEWGLVVEGFTPPPVILAPYNPPYYNDLLTAYGLEKAKDLLVYYMDQREGYQIPERILQLTDRVQERYHVTVRAIDMRNLERDVITLLKIANTSIEHNWGYYPVTEAEARGLARDLKQI